MYLFFQSRYQILHFPPGYVSSPLRLLIDFVQLRISPLYLYIAGGMFLKWISAISLESQRLHYIFLG